jgi:D-alanyl-D-alanine dipeptidase
VTPAGPATPTRPPTLRVEEVGRHRGFRPLAAIAGVAHDLRYAGVDNFAGRALYRGIDCAWLREEAAHGLEAAARWLAQHAPGHGLLVLDALRPQRVQEAIWAEVSGTPMAAYFADPRIGSIHSYGLAVDVTLLGPDGRALDMGSGYDEMNERSHPALEVRHFALGRLGAEHLRARGLLYAAMAEGGFHGIDTEWWHFDHGDRHRVRREEPLVY